MNKTCLSLIVAIISMSALLTVPVHATEYCNHDYITDRTEYHNNSNHYIISVCKKCGAEKKREAEHSKDDSGYSYEYIDKDYHKEIFRCVYCKELIYKYEGHYHGTASNAKYVFKPYDNTYHEMIHYCGLCDGVIGEPMKVQHFLSNTGGISRYDNTYHYTTEKCRTCGAEITTHEEHDFSSYSDPVGYKKYDDANHIALYECRTCHASVPVQKKHEYVSMRTNRATPKKEATFTTSCKICGQTKPTVSKVYKYGTDYSYSYDVIKISPIYEREGTRDVTVKLERPWKGAIIKLKIGKKTYKKKLGNSKKVKFQIAPAKYKERISVTITYKGKTIGKLWKDTAINKVQYARKIQLGMTESEVKKIYGAPYSTGAAVGGYIYWFYKGWTVTFQNGRVRSYT